MEKAVNSKQMATLIFMSVMALKIFMAPGLFLIYSGRNGWIPMAIFVCIELVEILLVLIVIKINPNMTFLQIMQKTFGKVLTKIILAVLITILTVKLTLMLGEVRMFFSTSTLGSVDFGVSLAALLTIFVLFSLKGLRPFARMAQLFFPFMIGALILLFMLTVKNLDLSGLLPVESVGVGECMKRFPLWFGDVAVLLVFAGEVKTEKKFLPRNILYAVASSVAVMYFAVVMFATYGDYPDVIEYGHNLSNMVLYSSGSYLYGRFDIPIFCIWIVSVFIQIMLSFYVIAEFMRIIFGAKRIIYFSVITAVALMVLCELFFSDKSSLLSLCTGWPRYICIFSEVLLPLSIIVSTLIRRRNVQKENVDI